METVSRESIRAELTRRVEFRTGRRLPEASDIQTVSHEDVGSLEDEIPDLDEMPNLDEPQATEEMPLPEPGTTEVAVKALYLVVAGGGCPGCEEAQEEFKKEIASGQMTVVSVQDDKGIEIVMKLGLYALPVVVAETVEGEYVVME